jgi:hypothetical protein
MEMPLFLRLDNVRRGVRMAAAEPLKITHNLDGGEMRRNDIDKRRKIFATKVRSIDGAYLTARDPPNLSFVSPSKNQTSPRY